MVVQPKRVSLFNCDNTYDLKTVEEFLVETGGKHGFKISVDPHYFRLGRMTEMVDTTLPTLKMDFAIFVVHTNEIRVHGPQKWQNPSVVLNLSFFMSPTSLEGGSNAGRWTHRIQFLFNAFQQLLHRVELVSCITVIKMKAF